MAVSSKHVRHQGPVLATLASTAVAALRQQVDARMGRSAPMGMPSLPSPDFSATIPPRPADLVRDYVRNTGGDASAYKGTLPPHMFPQWGFPLAAKTLVGLPYPLVKVLNGGCRLQMNAPLPMGEPLHVTARLEDIDDNGRRAVLHQRVVTGTREHPEAVVADLFAIVPLPQPPGAAKPEKKPPVRVPADAEELQRWRIGASAGLDFAKLTGDFNPVHWVRSYAKAAGFRSTILHGFATLARTIEGLQRTIFAGSIHALHVVDVKFTKPLVLPAKVGLYISPGADGQTQVFVGDAPGGPAYLAGTFVRKHEAST
jgi:acyl dehydratase